MSLAGFAYEGSELELFEHAIYWKRYWSAHVRRHLGQRVLEVGAGIGANTPYLTGGSLEWVCLEPDPKMAALLVARLRAHDLPATQVIAGTIADLPSTPSFDSIVYIDVLEHIKDDGAEVAEAAKRLRKGGKLIVLSPAHAWLFSAFDRSIGHFRRYSGADLRAFSGAELELLSLRQLDSVGILASIMNRFALRQEIPNRIQILLWDRLMVPMSRVLDPLLFYQFGKSILATWRRR